MEGNRVIERERERMGITCRVDSNKKCNEQREGEKRGWVVQQQGKVSVRGERDLRAMGAEANQLGEEEPLNRSGGAFHPFVRGSNKRTALCTHTAGSFLISTTDACSREKKYSHQTGAIKEERCIISHMQL